MPLLDAVLSQKVKNTFVAWQALPGGKSAIRQKFVAMVNPLAPDFDLLSKMLVRTQDFQAAIDAAKTANELQSWVMPLPAAIAFEGVFQQCAAFWMAAPTSAAVGVLEPSVIAFADNQATAFYNLIKK